MYAATDFYRTFRFLMTLIAAFDMYATQQNVISAFTKTKLPHSVYVRCPPRFNRTDYAIKLNNALYGLPESAQLWVEELAETLISFGFKRTHENLCLFTHPTKAIIIFFYVNNIIIAGANKNDVHNVNNLIASKYACQKAKKLQ